MTMIDLADLRAARGGTWWLAGAIGFAAVMAGLWVLSLDLQLREAKATLAEVNGRLAALEATSDE